MPAVTYQSVGLTCSLDCDDNYARPQESETIHEVWAEFEKNGVDPDKVKPRKRGAKISVSHALI